MQQHFGSLFDPKKKEAVLRRIRNGEAPPKFDAQKPAADRRVPPEERNPVILQIALDKCLIEAIDNGDIAKVTKYLELGANVDSKGAGNSSGLMCALSSEYVNIALLLIEKGADVTAKNHFKGTALHTASAKGWVDIVKLLIEKGADINVKEKLSGSTPLDLARLYGHDEVIEILLKNGAKE